MAEPSLAGPRGRETWRAILAAHDRSGSPAALAAADEALAACPDDVEFLAAKGRQLSLLRRFDEAETCLARALELAPEDATVLLHLAQLWVTLGRYATITPGPWRSWPPSASAPNASSSTTSRACRCFRA